MNQITREEITDVLKGIADKRLFCQTNLRGLNWSQCEPCIEVDGWEITFFIESMWIYDIYDVRAPDGRIATFCQHDSNSGIELFLSDWYVAKLCQALGAPLTDDDVASFSRGT